MKMLVRGGLVAAALLLCAGLGACQSLAGVVASVTPIAGQLAGPVPGQATTLGDATQLADLATKATQVAVDSGVVKLSHDQLVKLSALNDALHAAVVDLNAANAKGQALDFAAFNAALDAWNTYAGQVGVPKPPAS